MAITLRDIARESGVSPMTVSRVLNGKNAGQVAEETAEKIRGVALRLGYADRSAAAKLSRLLDTAENGGEPRKIYCLIPYRNFLDEPHAGARSGRDTAMLILDCAMELGVSLEFLPATCQNDPIRPNWEMLRRLGRGSRVITDSYWYIAPLLELGRRGARIAMLSSQFFWRDLYRASTRDWAHFVYRNADAFAMTVTRLLESGRRRIATIAFERYMDEPAYPRTTGYFRALEEAGNSFRCVIPIELSFDTTAERIRRAYEQTPFDALLFTDWSASEKIDFLPPEVLIVRPGTFAAEPPRIPGSWRLVSPGREMVRHALLALLAEQFVPEERFYDGVLNME